MTDAVYRGCIPAKQGLEVSQVSLWNELAGIEISGCDQIQIFFQKRKQGLIAIEVGRDGIFCFIKDQLCLIDKGRV